jgi:alkanesulfonate monooxygenase
LGLDHFILSGYPHLEEAYIFGEGVRPLLAKRGLLGDADAAAKPTGPVRSAFLPSVGDVSAS